MGLTIHYDVKSTTKSEAKARQLVEKMRQLAMDLPFESVSELIDVSGDACDYEKNTDPELKWMLIQAGTSVECPWNKQLSRRVHPSRVIGFSINVGDGCEPINIGLVQYPAEIEWEYKARDDTRFWAKQNASVFSDFSYSKFSKWANKNFPNQYIHENRLTEMRTVKTRERGWTWGSFCKTEYANEPDCGGLPNFLRCHISAITFLDRVGELPTVTVKINDEGHYGPAIYTDDCEVENPIYTLHDATYNVGTLITEIQESAERIAALVGALGDAYGRGMVAPIHNYSNFEQLEFKGAQRNEVQNFLKAMAGIKQ